MTFSPGDPVWVWCSNPATGLELNQWYPATVISVYWCQAHFYKVYFVDIACLKAPSGNWSVSVPFIKPRRDGIPPVELGSWDVIEKLGWTPSDLPELWTPSKTWIPEEA